MPTAPSMLPDNIDALKALVIAERDARQSAENLAVRERATATQERERGDRLERLLKELQRALFGRRSERLDPDQLQLVLEDLEGAVAEAEAEKSGSKPRPRQRRTNRGNLPKHLLREEVIVEPESTVCSCGSPLHRIGEDRSERLDVIPAQFRVIVTVRPKYGCRCCEAGVVQAPVPARLIEGGMPTEALVAHVLVGKYADHLPLYRQAQIMSRQGIDLDRSTLADWVGRAAFELRPVFERLVKHLKASTKLFMDETKAPVLDPGRGRTKTGYLWALARDDRPWGGADPPAVAYFYAPGRAGRHAEGFLDGFSGILQVDGYAGYNRLNHRPGSNGPIRLAYCWAHARRKLYEIAKAGTAPIAEDGLEQIAKLYRIEADIRGQSPERRRHVRQAKTKPLIEDFEKWVDTMRARVSGSSRLGEALRYITKHRHGLKRFLDDGRIEIDSNVVERSIRPLALNRKNALFAGHDEGAKNWGMIASLIETCKLNGINPQAYLETTLIRIVDGHPQSRIDELLPWAQNRPQENVA
jgi:transposase